MSRQSSPANTPFGEGEESAAGCASCGAALLGPFCHQCGQGAERGGNSLRAFLAESLSDVLDIRSRPVRSLLDLVFRPGELTVAFLGGRRARYMQPLQLYLLAAAVFFLANSLRPFVQVTPDNQIVSSLSSVKTFQSISTEQLAALSARGVSPDLFRERFRSAVSQGLPPFMIGSILAFALALFLFSPRHPPLLHLVFALNWIAFFMLAMGIERLLPVAVDRYVVGFLTLAALLHLILSLRRAYRHRWGRAIGSGLGLMIAFNIVLAGWVIAVVAYALWQTT